MRKLKPVFPKKVRLLHEIALSIYLPLLLIAGNAAISSQHPARNSWVDDLQLLIKSGPSHFIFVFIILWAISAAVLFVCLRILANLSVTDLILRTLGGIVVVVGFPIVIGYVSFRGYFRMLGSIPRALLYAYAPERWLEVEVAVSLMCVLLYGFRKWAVEPWWGLLLVGLHFAIWAWFIGWPVIAVARGAQLPIFLGFLSSLAWGSYIRPTGDGDPLAQASAAP